MIINSKLSPRFFALSLTALFLTVLLLTACGGGNSASKSQPQEGLNPSQQEQKADAPSEHGVGPAEQMDLKLSDQLDEKMVGQGKGVYEMKCQACHSLADNRVVGPGWKGITSRRTPQWIVNMMMNPDAMLDKDPVAQKQLEECMVRMPNQNLQQADARNVLEFMRKNDK